jgi:cold shock CspA family protein
VKFQVEMSPKGPSAFDVRLKPAES